MLSLKIGLADRFNYTEMKDLLLRMWTVRSIMAVVSQNRLHCMYIQDFLIFQTCIMEAQNSNPPWYCSKLVINNNEVIAW